MVRPGRLGLGAGVRLGTIVLQVGGGGKGLTSARLGGRGTGRPPGRTAREEVTSDRGGGGRARGALKAVGVAAEPGKEGGAAVGVAPRRRLDAGGGRGAATVVAAVVAAAGQHAEESAAIPPAESVSGVVAPSFAVIVLDGGAAAIPVLSGGTSSPPEVGAKCNAPSDSTIGRLTAGLLAGSPIAAIASTREAGSGAAGLATTAA